MQKMSKLVAICNNLSEAVKVIWLWSWDIFTPLLLVLVLCEVELKMSLFYVSSYQYANLLCQNLFIYIKKNAGNKQKGFG